MIPDDPGSADFGGIHAAASVNAAAGVGKGWRMMVRDAATISSYGVAIADVWLADTAACRASTIEVKAYTQAGGDSDTPTPS